MDIISPVAKSFWHEHLIHHPDRQFAELILSGLEDRFPIGFDTTSKLKPAKSNLISAREHPGVVSAYVQLAVRQVTWAPKRQQISLTYK